jgi:hypothetical protein
MTDNLVMMFNKFAGSTIMTGNGIASEAAAGLIGCRRLEIAVSPSLDRSDI